MVAVFRHYARLFGTEIDFLKDVHGMSVDELTDLKRCSVTDPSDNQHMQRLQSFGETVLHDRMFVKNPEHNALMLKLATYASPELTWRLRRRPTIPSSEAAHTFESQSGCDDGQG